MIQAFLNGFNEVIGILEAIIGQPLTPYRIPILLIVILYMMLYYSLKYRRNHSLKKLAKIENESKSVVFNDKMINEALQLETEKRKFEMMSLVNYSEKDNFMALLRFFKGKYTIRFLGSHYEFLDVDWQQKTIKVKRNAWAWYEMIAFTTMSVMMLVVALFAFISGNNISLVISLLAAYGVLLLNHSFFIPMNIKKEFDRRVKLENKVTT